MRNRICVVAGLVSAWCSVAVAGKTPAWCKGEKLRNGDGKRVSSIGGTLDEIVGFLCDDDPDKDARRAEVEKLRAEVSKELFMTDADWSDAVDYISKNGGGNTEEVIKISASSLASMTPMDQYIATRYGFKDDDGYGAGMNGDALYIADALGDSLTETGRLGFLERCIKSANTGREDGDIAMWAVCAEDAQKFDGAKFGAEVRGDTAHSPEQRTMLHVRAVEVLRGLKDIAQRRDKLFKKDDAYKKVFEVAQKGRDEWQKTLGANKDLLSLAQRMESARWFHSRKQFAGCEDKTQKALADAASKLDAKLFKNMYDERDDPFHGFADKAGPILVDNPEFHLAAIGYALCQPDSSTGGWLGGVLRSVPGYRGPRTAGMTAVIHQKFELDDTHLKEVGKPAVGTRPYRAKGGSASAGGVLKSLKAGSGDDKGKMIATLEKTMIKQEDCVKFHETGRISGWDSAGGLVYERKCDKTAIVEHDHTWEPFAISERTAKWLKPGQLFSSVSNGGVSDVIAVWPNKNAKQPSQLFGGELK